MWFFGRVAWRHRVFIFLVFDILERFSLILCLNRIVSWFHIRWKAISYFRPEVRKAFLSWSTLCSRCFDGLSIDVLLLAYKYGCLFHRQTSWNDCMLYKASNWKHSLWWASSNETYSVNSLCSRHTEQTAWWTVVRSEYKWGSCCETTRGIVALVSKQNRALR